jgi:hypothetical protein
VATFTDRVLPNAFPTADRAIFDSTVRSLAVGDPPPRETQRVATSFAVLASLQRDDFFTRGQRRRAVLLITDGESDSFDATAVSSALAASPRLHLVIARVGGGRDRLHADGHAAGSYRPDPAGARRAIDQLAAATGGRSFTGSAAGPAAAVRAAIGAGPTSEVRSAPETVALAPIVALISLVPLLFLLTRFPHVPRQTRRFP